MGGWFYSGLLGGKIAVEVREVQVSRLPRGLEGKKIAFLSDVHAGWMFPAKRVAQVVREISALEPDLLLIGGDLAETRQDELKVIQALGTIPAPLGRYAVLGNNDSQRFMDAGRRQLRQAMERSGISLLVNERAEIAVEGAKLTVVGLDEMKYGRPRTEGLFAGMGEENFCVLLSHYPQMAVAVAQSGANPGLQLALCGHTHGGQFRLGKLTPYAVGYERKMRTGGPSLVHGWRRIGQTWILVSNGLGTSSLPLRIGAQPQIHKIILRTEKNHG